MKKGVSLRVLLIVMTTILLFVGSVFVLIYINKSVDERRYRELSISLDQATQTVREKVNETIDSLYDLRGLFGLGEVDSDMWRDYTQAVLKENHPKSESYAYVEKVRREDLFRFEEKMRESSGSGYATFRVFPKTENAYSYPVKYLYTTDSEIKTLLGFDLETSNPETFR